MQIPVLSICQTFCKELKDGQKLLLSVGHNFSTKVVMSHTTNLGGSICNSQEETGTLHVVAAVNSEIENILVVMPCPDADILVLSIHQQIKYFSKQGEKEN